MRKKVWGLLILSHALIRLVEVFLILLAKLRFVNESCTSNEECYNYMFNSTECLNGFCACANDYIAEEQQLLTGEARLVCTPGMAGF